MNKSIRRVAASAGALMLLMSAPALAQDAKPAVSDYNWKFDAAGGFFADESVYYFEGSVTTPLTFSTGLQIDGIGGLMDGDGFGGVAAHLFWRDPDFAMAGLYGSYFNNNYGVGYDVVNAAVEGEFYLGMFSVEGLAGAQFLDGDDADFLGGLTLAAYPIDDLRVYGGYRYWFGESEGVAGLEWQFPGQSDNSINFGLFADGRFQEDDNSMMGGVRVYLGSQKTLIRRHREDDPAQKLTLDLYKPAPAAAGCPPGYVKLPDLNFNDGPIGVTEAIVIERPVPSGCVPEEYFDEFD